MNTETSDTLAIIGATGKAGTVLLREALSRGYHVRALARKPETITTADPKLTVIPGSVGDSEAVGRLLQGCSAVVSALGQRPGEEPVFTRASELVAGAMKRIGIRRYIVLAGLGVKAPGDSFEPSRFMKRTMLRMFYPSVMRDRRNEYLLLERSGLDWTLVRAPLITEGEPAGSVRIDGHRCPGSKITKTALARAMLDMLDAPEYDRKAVFVFEA